METGAISGRSVLEEVLARDLPSLQNREKWHGTLPNLKLNALVSLVNKNASRGRRNLGRIDQKLRPRESNYKDL